MLNAHGVQDPRSARDRIPGTVLESIASQPQDLGIDVGSGCLAVASVIDVQQFSSQAAEQVRGQIPGTILDTVASQPQGLGHSIDKKQPQLLSRTGARHYSRKAAVQTRERFSGTIPDSVPSQPQGLGYDMDRGQLEEASGTDALQFSRKAAEETKGRVLSTVLETAATPLQQQCRSKPGQGLSAATADFDEANVRHCHISEPPPTVPSQPADDDGREEDRSEHPFFAHCRELAAKPPVLRIDDGSPVGKMQHPVRAYFAQFPEHVRSTHVVRIGTTSSSSSEPPPSKPTPPPKPAPRAELRPAPAPAVNGAAAAPQQPGKRSRRTKRYSRTERDIATPLGKKLMECADYNSNVTGGAPGFRSLLQEAMGLASPRKRRRLDEVRQTFKANTPGVHGCKLDELIAEWRDELRASAPRGRS